MIARKKSQAALEFLIITGAVLFLFTLFFIAIQTNTGERNKEKENLFIKDLALSIKDEINLATQASDGYRREFKVPENILGKDYELEIIDNSIYIRTDKNALSLKVDEVIGEIKKGENIIRKEDGEVYLN